MAVRAHMGVSLCDMWDFAEVSEIGRVGCLWQAIQWVLDWEGNRPKGGMLLDFLGYDPSE